MKTLILILTALLLAGCEYETINEETVRETEVVAADAGAPPDATPADAAPADAGGDSDAMSNIWSRGASGSKVLTRGNPSPSRVLAETFLGADGKAEAGVYTVQFSVAPTAGVVPFNVNATVTYAIITWMVGGNQVQRILSVSNGASITGVGSGATVVVYDATIVAPGDPVPQYIVAVSISPGSRGSNGQPVTYYPPSWQQSSSGGGAVSAPIPGNSGILNAFPGGGDQAIIPVPENAGAISVQVITTEGTPDLVQVDQGATGSDFFTTYSPALYNGFVPLNPGANQIFITNLNTAGVLSFSIVFGIEG